MDAFQKPLNITNDIICLDSDGSPSVSANSLVEDFVNLSVSGQEAVLTAAARIEKFRRLGRANQVNALRVAGRLTRSALEEGVATGNGSDPSTAASGIVNVANIAFEDANTRAKMLLRVRGACIAAYMRGDVAITPLPINLEDWQLLCVVCAAQPHASIRDCIQVCLACDFVHPLTNANLPQAIKLQNCNIYDVMHALDTGTVARSFRTAGELATYIFRTNKVMPKYQAKLRQMTKVLLKELDE